MSEKKFNELNFSECTRELLGMTSRLYYDSQKYKRGGCEHTVCRDC